LSLCWPEPGIPDEHIRQNLFAYRKTIRYKLVMEKRCGMFMTF